MAKLTDKQLDDYAQKINEAHEQSRQHLRQHREWMVKAGTYLVKVKGSLLQHGEWMEWVHEHLKFSLRTAEDYMRVARNQHLFVATKSATVANMSRRALMAYIDEQEGKPKKSKADKPDTAESKSAKAPRHPKTHSELSALLASLNTNQRRFILEWMEANDHVLLESWFRGYPHSKRQRANSESEAAKH